MKVPTSYSKGFLASIICTSFFFNKLFHLLGSTILSDLSLGFTLIPIGTTSSFILIFPL